MKLTDTIHLLRLDFEIPLGPQQKLSRFVNVLIIFGETITLVDTGTKSNLSQIFSYIKQNGRAIDEIATVILSHAHPDHIGSAAAIKDRTNCSVLAHAGDAGWIEDIQRQYSQRPVPGFFDLVDRPVKIDAFLEDRQQLHFNDSVTAVITHSPGHSKGSISILFVEDRLYFTADAIPLENDIPNYDHYLDLCRSLRSIRQRNDYDILLTSWTPPVQGRTNIEAIITNGKAYLKRIDAVVKKTYIGTSSGSLTSCAQAIEALGLPSFFVNPIVDRAFRGHLTE